MTPGRGQPDDSYCSRGVWPLQFSGPKGNRSSDRFESFPSPETPMWKSLLSVACPLIIASCSAPADDSVADSNPQRTGVQGENPSASDLTETGHSEQTGQIGEAGAVH